MSSKRSLSNPPDYYFKLNKRQQVNWERTTRKIEQNEDKRKKYPPFQSPSNITIIHLHYRSPIETLEELIVRANETKIYIIDTESQMINKVAKGALVQIQFIHPIHDSTLILIEMFYLPKKDSMLFKKIKELCSIILSGENEIITWGTLRNEFRNFHTYGLFEIGKVQNKINLQNDFSDWHNTLPNNTHPEKESRDEQTWKLNDMNETPGERDDPTQEATMNIICNCGHHSHYDPNGTWSLQDAIASACQQFLDKSETINKWGCGLDVNLNTWHNKLFSKFNYDPTEEKEKRRLMINYAIGDCTAVAQLYFIIKPTTTINNNALETPTTTSRIVYINNDDQLSDISEDELIEILKPKFNKKQKASHEPTKSKTSTSTKNIINIENDLSDISEDELIEILKPKFNKKQKVLHEPAELIISTTQQELIELNLPEEQLSSQQPQQSKAEKQRKKNQKLKWKQKYQPNFQHKLKRPIYYKYDYKKIRAQLKDDNIHTSHQITINQKLSEVMIVVKSQQELDRAKNIIKINYFSKNQYLDRWGEN